MPRYRIKPGIVLTSICGEYLLVSAKAMRQEVPYLTQVNESSGFLLRLLEKGATLAELEQAVQEEYEIADRAEAQAVIETFVQQMLSSGYLLSEGENNE